MKNYENVYILRGSLTEEQAKNKLEEITKYFKDVKTFKNEESLNGYQGKKNLAYEVKGEKTGHYYITHFEGTEKEVAEIERNLRINDNVIKFITVRF